MKKLFLISTSLLFCLCLAAGFMGCKGKSPAAKGGAAADGKTAAKAKATGKASDFNPYPLDGVKDMLKKQGYDPERLMEFDGNLYYLYEADKADQYDAQFEAAVGELLGLLGGYTRETATVVCTGGGEPVMQFTAKKSDLVTFAAGKLKPGELFTRLEIKSVKAGK